MIARSLTHLLVAGELWCEAPDDALEVGGRHAKVLPGPQILQQTGVDLKGVGEGWG